MVCRRRAKKCMAAKRFVKRNSIRIAVVQWFAHGNSRRSPTSFRENVDEEVRGNALTKGGRAKRGTKDGCIENIFGGQYSSTGI